jgi:uncharacterized protein
MEKFHIRTCELGRGAFAARDLKAGEEILRFEGRIISLEETLRKGCTSPNPLQIGPYTYIDLQEPGVLVNHSCDPNAGVWKDWSLIAVKDIKQDEQIFFDYSTSMWEDCWSMRCKCGTRLCRGLVRDFNLLPYERRRYYLDLDVVQSFIVDRIHNRKTRYEIPEHVPSTPIRRFVTGLEVLSQTQ